MSNPETILVIDDEQDIATLINGGPTERVHPGRAKKIGGKKLKLTQTADGILSPLKDTPVLHKHGDMFDLRDGAINLASTDVCDHQAFICSPHALAFRFHPEARLQGFEHWLIGHACEISATPDVTAPQRHADTEQLAAAMASRGQKILQDWLNQLPRLDAHFQKRADQHAGH